MSEVKRAPMHAKFFLRVDRIMHGRLLSAPNWKVKCGYVYVSCFPKTTWTACLCYADCRSVWGLKSERFPSRGQVFGGLTENEQFSPIKERPEAKEISYSHTVLLVVVVERFPPWKSTIPRKRPRTIAITILMSLSFVSERAPK